MTTTHTQLQWVTTLGWARTHLLRAGHYATTRCGKSAHNTLVTDSNKPPCQLCRRTLT